MKIEIIEEKNKGFALAYQDGEKAGLMSYSIPKSDFIIIDHTEVDDTFQGQWVGKRMRYKIVEMAREKNLKIIPLCPFDSAMFKKLDDIKDVLKS